MERSIRTRYTPRMLFAVILGSFLLSMTVKLLADTFLHARIPLIGRFVGLLPAYNEGVAFGIRLPGLLQPLFILAALGIVAYVAFHSAKTTLSQWGFGLILGGALGNLADRTLDGKVTDFFQVGTFPIFNVADSWITIGVVILLLESIAGAQFLKRK
jgi:signal peptidase II